MNKEFSLNIIFLISINLLIKPFFIFGIDRTVQNVVGTETYGVYFTLLSLTYLFGIINDFGIQNFNNRSISQNPSLLQQYFPNILAIKKNLTEKSQLVQKEQQHLIHRSKERKIMEQLK